MSNIRTHDVNTHEVSTPDTSAASPDTALLSLVALQQALAQSQQALAECRAREVAALRLAAHDALTGLPNRWAFVQQTSRALQEHASSAQVFCLLFIDLDGFKAINDDLGDAAGDGAQVASAARGCRFADRDRPPAERQGPSQIGLPAARWRPEQGPCRSSVADQMRPSSSNTTTITSNKPTPPKGA